ncbi:hypothetical protein GCM10007231_22360 [Nocardioides daphniae]|uniref:DUF2207 domain-containing protein n=1 Tax=Nocardioides daphniae TaxID=402297 RepID=A0ABQ1QCD2_9ACTN|nr:hypothetical protein GCM10007231_22360 [Nocardioides daphniae]
MPWLVLAALVTLACLPALRYLVGDAPSAGGAEVRVSRYNAVLEVDDDADLVATETLVLDVGDGGAAVSRVFDEYDADQPRLRRVPREVAVVVDGRPGEFEWRTEQGGRFHVVEVGGRLREPGQHTVVLKYEIDDVQLASGSGASEVRAELVPDTIAQAVDVAELTLRLPAAPDAEVTCAQGETGCAADVDGATVTVTAQGLAPRTPVTVTASLPVAASEARTRQLWPVWMNPVLSPWPWLLAPVAAAVVFAGWLGRRIALGASFDDATAADAVPVEGVSPEQAAYLLSGRGPDPATTAELRGWATREGLVSAAGPRSGIAFGVVAALVAYAVWLVLLGPHMSLVALVPGAFAAFALPAVRPGLTVKRTNAGRRLAARIRTR